MIYRNLFAYAALFLLVSLPAFAFQEGYASWYGGKFHGRKTASGEIFNTNDFTAAHRTLPFGTKIKVTNTVNGKSVIVRVNDRGPFVKGRILDLSQAAAAALDMIGSGTALVRIETIGSPARETSAAGSGTQGQPASSAEEVSPDAFPAVSIQVASYRVQENAADTLDLLKKNGIDANLETTNQGMTRVIINNVHAGTLQGLKRDLALLGFPQVLVRQAQGK